MRFTEKGFPRVSIVLPSEHRFTSSSIDDPYSHSSGASESGSSTSVQERSVMQNIEPGDQEKFSHYVRKEDIMESALTGNPVIALCGKVWTPGRDPEKFPVCPQCQEIYESMNAD